MTENLILDTDSYKSSHFLQFPPGTEAIYSYIEARSGHYENLVWYGALASLLDKLSQKITIDMVEEANSVLTVHGEPFPYQGWKYVVEELNGDIPLRIRALPEGSIVPVSIPLMTIESTCPKAFWMPGWFETMLMRVWYPTTVATRSKYIKGIIYEYLQKTSDDPDGEINFKLHDFGARGVSSRESANIGGSAHLINFMGTDTVSALGFIKKYYGENMAGFSIPAAEHSTITSWGKENESIAYGNMIAQFGKPGSLVAVVSDSYNIYEAVEKIWCSEIFQTVIKDKGCTIVIRPDSGHPATVVNRILDIMKAKIGMTQNSKRFWVLPAHMRIIQGDGIDESSIQEILSTMARNGYSASNIAFGMGGALLQKLDRDTMSFAQKCSTIKINGSWQKVSKNPIGDSGKKSKAGKVDTFIDEKGRYGWRVDSSIGIWNSAMQEVFLNGEVKNMSNWAQIRERANARSL
jgi:nicotinamide phosphoribosyltransferase